MIQTLTDLIVNKTESLGGVVRAPSSKAYTHRALIASSLSEGRSVIESALFCDDTSATIKACSSLGAKIEEVEGRLIVDGTSRLTTPEDVIHCRDSGSTIRFITPVCALADGVSVLTGNSGLRKRPMEPLLASLRQLGVQCYSTGSKGYPPIIVFGGGIKGGRTSIRGDVSSQFISGLLFGTPKAQMDTEIRVTTQLESKPYVKMTLDVIRNQGIEVKSSDYRRFLVPCGQEYTPRNNVIEGDYSSAAFLLAAAIVTESHLKITNLQKETVQGDRVIVNVLKEMNVEVEVGKDFVEVVGGRQSLRGVEIDVRDSPDLTPVYAALACFAQGETKIRGAARLRFKESDRITSLVRELTKLGVTIKERQDGLIIKGDNKLRGNELDSHNDHRIAMACAIIALRTDGATVIHGIECIDKSYPDFLSDMTALGAEFEY